MTFDLNSLSLEELFAINKRIVAVLKAERATKVASITNALVVGSKVEFFARTYKAFATVTKIKRRMVEVTELSTSSQPGRRWNVDAQLLTLVK